MKEKKSRRLVAIMFTDIVGYTALMQRDEAAAARARANHREVFDRLHKAHEGEVLQYYGDGTLSVFQSAVEAVECAIGIQQALQSGEIVPLRIGIHLGDIVFDETEVFGDGVNLASRIESMGVAGSILLSGAVYNELKNHPHIQTVSLGEFGLKNIGEAVSVYAIDQERLKVPSRTELKGKQTQLHKTIAVLPFVNRSPDEEHEYFSDGMTEEIINALAKIEGLKVTSRTSSFYFKHKQIPLKQIGQELNVSTILEGSIRLVGNKMRLTAQLVDVAEDYQFWSETFNRSIEDVFSVQDEISLLIADRLREHIGHFDIEDQLVEAAEVPVEGYKQYLKGKHYILKINPADIKRGIELLSRLIEEYPQFALPYFELHKGYMILSTTGVGSSEELMLQGQTFLEKAIQLDPDLPESQLNLAWSAFIRDWDLAGTYHHLNKVLEIRPVVEYYQTMTSTLTAEGKLVAAHHYIDTAFQLDPFSGINYHLKGFIFYLQEQYEAAIAQFQKSAELEPEFKTSRLYWGEAMLLLGQTAEALAFFQNLPDDESGDLTKLGGMTMTQIALGNQEEAMLGINELKAALPTSSKERAMLLLILCYAMLGEPNTALDYLEESIESRLPLVIYLFVDPVLAPLREHARFEQLMHQVLGENTIYTPVRRKYKKALLTKEEIDQYREQLNILMQTQALYLDPTLTLRTLAQELNLPANHLSQLLNEGFGKNFAEYVNTYRLEAFKAKVANPDHQHLTLLAMAYESGFNSKTVFNTFFKKMTGQTPKAYWKEVVKQ